MDSKRHRRRRRPRTHGERTRHKMQRPLGTPRAVGGTPALRPRPGAGFLFTAPEALGPPRASTEQHDVRWRASRATPPPPVTPTPPKQCWRPAMCGCHRQPIARLRVRALGRVSDPMSTPRRLLYVRGATRPPTRLGGGGTLSGVRAPETVAEDSTTNTGGRGEKGHARVSWPRHHVRLRIVWSSLGPPLRGLVGPTSDLAGRGTPCPAPPGLVLDTHGGGICTHHGRADQWRRALGGPVARHVPAAPRWSGPKRPMSDLGDGALCGAWLPSGAHCIPRLRRDRLCGNNCTAVTRRTDDLASPVRWPDFRVGRASGSAPTTTPIRQGRWMADSEPARRCASANCFLPEGRLMEKIPIHDLEHSLRSASGGP